ncbi:MAG TPA: hypothetical protein VGM78_05465, partial [Ilumatobacteraceae bacterium]
MDLVDEYLTLACLAYDAGDSSARWQQANEIATAHPGLAASSLHVAAAMADVVQIESMLAVVASL